MLRKIYSLLIKILIGRPVKSSSLSEDFLQDIDQIYKYSNFSISLPKQHLLPEFQREHPLYDRFLPHLSKCLEPNSVVVDVGANCGDTMAAMIDKNKNIHFVCIEPDGEFYDYLKKNVQTIESAFGVISVKTVQALVGKSISNVVLEGYGGTKKASLNKAIGEEQVHVSSTLDDLLLASNVKDVRLIKSDVDGFDYDVIDSANVTLESCKPILFFECQIDNQSQKAGYKKTISDLYLKGYNNWVVFDNFGSVMMNSSDPAQLEQVIDYVWRQNLGKSTRTIYYVDLLAFVSKDIKFVARVVNEYNLLCTQ